VGLDAVRVGVMEVGGTVTATTVTGKGTTWTLSIPLPRTTFEARVLRVPHVPFPVVVPADWEPTSAGSDDDLVIDIAHRLGIVEDATRANALFFAKDSKRVGIVTDRAPQLASARRLVAAPAPAVFEVVILDAVEGLLLHLDRVT
jgi:hypothetical protein